MEGNDFPGERSTFQPQRTGPTVPEAGLISVAFRHSMWYYGIWLYVSGDRHAVLEQGPIVCVWRPHKEHWPRWELGLEGSSISRSILSAVALLYVCLSAVSCSTSPETNMWVRLYCGYDHPALYYSTTVPSLTLQITPVKASLFRGEPFW